MNAAEKKISAGIYKWCAEHTPEGRKKTSLIPSTATPTLFGVTPGLRLQVVERGRLKVDLAVGATHKYYDLASLTKIIFAVPAIIRLVENQQIKLNDPIAKAMGWRGSSKILLEHVLSHVSGLPWWEAFYKMPTGRLDRTADQPALVSREQLRARMEKILAKAKRTPQQKSVYSDIDFILLGFLLEELHRMSLLDVWETLEWREQTPSFHFNPAIKLKGRQLIYKPLYKRELYAPTEKCPWRGKTLRGEVHDDNTWSFGGVSTHAGLFGTVDDVTRFGQILRMGYREKTAVRKFAQRAIPVAQGDWALGFMLPTKGSASCGRHFSPQSFGHTGFTGTSLWYDPKQDLLVTILSNRVHPTRDNSLFVRLRPAIHEMVQESLR